MPPMPAAAQPWKTARSSARAIWMAAWTSGSRSGSARAARDVLHLGARQGERRAQLDQRLDLAERARDALDRRALQRGDAPEVDGALVPALRSDEVDELAGGELDA